MLRFTESESESDHGKPKTGGKVKCKWTPNI